ncbi:MAG: hypothetical protein QOI73_1350 [Solirubrobacteraceae bacterium]|nr:hypothetical protein [Solirubrobacteraceae bacterium]
MLKSRALLLTGALLATVAPAAALAATADPTPTLRGTPLLRILDNHHATLSFDSDRLARTKAGKLHATITFANGARVSGLKVNRDPDLLAKYIATVSSSRVMRHHEKFRVTFGLGASHRVTRVLDGQSVKKPELGGAPQMRIVDEHHATLGFASDRLQRTKAGKLDATITFANGERVSGLKRSGTHGTDATYAATISSPRIMSDHDTFKVTFRLGDSKTVTRTVTLYRVGAHT